MRNGTTTFYPGRLNKGFIVYYHTPREGWGIQWPKRCNNSKDEIKSLHVYNENSDDSLSQRLKQKC